MLELEKNSSKSTSVDDTTHSFIPTSNVRNGFRKKKGDSPFTYNLNLKVKKEKKQSNCTNPDPWARIVGSRNTAAIYMNGVATTALFDTGAEIQLVSKQFCEDNEWEIQPIENLTECSTVNGEIFGYEGFVEVNVQIPGRDFSEDHLFLVTSEISHQKEIPVVLGTYFIESLSKYLHGIDKDEFDSLDYTVKQAYLSWVEATRIREQYGCEPPLGFVKTTKPVLIQAGTSREIHGLTKIKHGGYTVNCISEPAIGHQLPKGLKLIPGYSPLSPGSCRVSTVLENNTGKDITIPARTTICQLGLANRIPKLIYPGDDYDNDHDPEEVDVETTSDDVIPADISLPSQFLLPNLDDSSSNEETEVTELYTEVEPTINDSGKDMQSINSEADSLVDTKELLEFIDTMDVRDASKVTESDTQEESVHDVTRQDDIDPKSESQFSSFMSYHEGESSSLDPGTNGQELSKSPIEDSTKRHDSGVVDQGDINSHDSDMIAYESNNTSVPSIDISVPSNMDSQSGDMTDDTSVNPIVDVEVEQVRRSARQRKQTQFYGNPWLYRIACNLTPWGLTELLQHSLSDMK